MRSQHGQVRGQPVLLDASLATDDADNERGTGDGGQSIGRFLWHAHDDSSEGGTRWASPYSVVSIRVVLPADMGHDMSDSAALVFECSRCRSEWRDGADEREEVLYMPMGSRMYAKAAGCVRSRVVEASGDPLRLSLNSSGRLCWDTKGSEDVVDVTFDLTEVVASMDRVVILAGREGSEEGREHVVEVRSDAPTPTVSGLPRGGWMRTSEAEDAAYGHDRSATRTIEIPRTTGVTVYVRSDAGTGAGGPILSMVK